MGRFFLAILAALVLAGPVAAQGDAIRGVISRQIEAFEADDFARAFTFASPGIRRLFRTPEIFGQMVRRGYPMVHRPGDVQFLDLSDDDGDGALRQVVRIRDAAGVVHMLEYRMIPTGDGWRIDGVRFLPRPDVGA